MAGLQDLLEHWEGAGAGAGLDLKLPAELPSTPSSVQVFLFQNGSLTPAVMDSKLLEDLMPLSPERTVYVNPKQYDRILKRRETRARLGLSTTKPKKQYLHTSRHAHAVNRPRGKSGRFLTKAELAKLAERVPPSGSSGSPAPESPDHGAASPSKRRRRA